MLLEELGVDYELALVDREENTHHSTQSLKLNPNGRISLRVDGDLPLYEAAAICLHLVDRHPENGVVRAIACVGQSARYRPIITLTAKATKEGRDKGIAAGASDYIAKPVDPATPLSLMHVWLRH